ncbi:MAG: SDR family NAD(P)-dependent oxidoreductase, partial [Candidatus Hodarchaeota archaeon]
MKQNKTSTINKSVNIKKAKILVTGGSGSLGRNIIKVLLSKGAKKIVSLSRDENVVKEAELEIGRSPVQFKLGDITDHQVITRLLKDVDVVFHLAALKHVSLAEQNPREAHRINVVGLLNLLDNSASVKRFVHISSDKAIGVINCYGATKLLGEYLVRESNELYPGNKYVIVRCPNLLASRGSVINIWKQ